jgi:hypothetical protein
MKKLFSRRHKVDFWQAFGISLGLSLLMTLVALSCQGLFKQVCQKSGRCKS